MALLWFAEPIHTALDAIQKKGLKDSLSLVSSCLLRLVLAVPRSSSSGVQRSASPYTLGILLFTSTTQTCLA